MVEETRKQMLEEVVNDLAKSIKFIEYKLNLVMENVEVLSEKKKEKSVMEIWKSRGKKEGSSDEKS